MDGEESHTDARSHTFQINDLVPCSILHPKFASQVLGGPSNIKVNHIPIKELTKVMTTWNGLD